MYEQMYGEIGDRFDAAIAAYDDSYYDRLYSVFDEVDEASDIVDDDDDDRVASLLNDDPVHDEAEVKQPDDEPDIPLPEDSQIDIEESDTDSGDRLVPPQERDPNLPKRPLRVFDSDELTERYFPRKDFIVSTLLTSGLSVLAGSPKVGKSWMVLSLCMSVAKGEPFLGMKTKKSGVLYIALEDDERRLQQRVMTITDECSKSFYMTTYCSCIGEELEKEICLFLAEHKDVRLIVIDTFQKVRVQGRDMSYANDYSEVSLLKKIADTLNIAILLVHHTRKQSDADYMNEISGTNGIAGSADTLMVLKKEKRASREATLSCTGRDIEDREFRLKMDRETCVWEVVSDSLKEIPDELPEEMKDLVGFMKKKGSFSGTNTLFTEEFTMETRWVLSPCSLKRLMNKYRYELEDLGVSFESYRNKKQRMIDVSYRERADLTTVMSD